MTTETNDFPTFETYAEFEKYHFATAIENAQGCFEHLPRHERRREEQQINKKIGQLFRTLRANWPHFKDRQEAIIAELTANFKKEGA